MTASPPVSRAGRSLIRAAFPPVMLACLAAASAAGGASAREQPAPAPAAAGAAVRWEPQEIRRDFAVGYAVTTGDVNGDRRPDIIAINGTQLVWFENPSWTMQMILDGRTPKDNVTIAAQDIDGDGRLDVALGAGWNPRDTTGGGTLHWVRQGKPGEPWTLHDIASEPTLHRIRWADVDGRGTPALIVAPLHGRGTSPPEWNGQGARLLVFRIPKDPVRDRWEPEAADDSFHILHNFLPVRDAGDDRDHLLTASREGVQRLRRGNDGTWTRTMVGAGAPGEIKLGRVGGRRVLATVEPWHGHSVVLYVEPAEGGAEKGALWTRRVIDEALAGGHALGWADFDKDGDDELAAGWREKEGGVALYDIAADGTVRAKTMIDAGGMTAEDLTIADLDADGRADVIASGRKTANVKIYWNRAPAGSAAKP